ncbi:MAG: CysS/YqeB C-terminal domain-containing protein, partial [Minisyncoccales bacterium]
PKEVAKLVIKRETARKNKDFEKADELRDKIKELGFNIDDKNEGVRVKKI